MNTTDMYSREKANQAHLDDIRRATHDGRRLRGANASSGREAAPNCRLHLAQAGAAAIAVLVSALLASMAAGHIAL